jgi:nitrate reductase gamma subunit
MHTMYEFVTGPMVWISFLVFIGGSIYRLGRMLSLTIRKEPFVFSFWSWKYGLRSIIRWSVPFATVNMKNNPAPTLFGFAFHICLMATPVFLLAHIVLWDESWNVSWWSLPDGLADGMTLMVVFCCLFFLYRRLTLPEVRYLTSASDYVMLAVVSAPFITGFFAYHQWFGYPYLLILHILSGEIMLMAIPFTRLSHMLYAPFTRAYMGSEFGYVRHARDW